MNIVYLQIINDCSIYVVYENPPLQVICNNNYIHIYKLKLEPLRTLGNLNCLFLPIVINKSEINEIIIVKHYH